jgi:hypothetical protein
LTLQISLVISAITFFVLWPMFRTLVRQATSRHLRWPLGAAILFLPWADELWIAYQFQDVCKTAGASISRKVTVDGFLDDTNRFSSIGVRTGLIVNPQAIRSFDQSGYKFRETTLSDGRIWRLERISEGLNATIHDRPESQYAFSRPISDATAGYRILCSEDVVVRYSTNEKIANYRYCKRYPGMIESLWMRFLHRGPIAYCPEQSSQLEGMLYTHALIPSSLSER